MTNNLNNEEEDEDDHASSDRDAWRPDFHWLTEELAVGGCFPPERALDLARHHAIRSIIDLRSEDCDDARSLGHAGIELLHLPTPDLEPASIAMLEEGISFARNSIARGGKVLIHCQHGIGRSPLLALCVLVDLGWEALDALEHSKTIRPIISPSRSQFQGWAKWLGTRGRAAPDYHTFGCIAYRHLANG
jgi:predicted protein tyrosine phosphatase